MATVRVHRWEYRTMVLEDEITDKAELDELGASGWELVAIRASRRMVNEDGSSFESDELAYLKRLVV